MSDIAEREFLKKKLAIVKRQEFEERLHMHLYQKVYLNYNKFEHIIKDKFFESVGCIWNLVYQWKAVDLLPTIWTLRLNMFFMFHCPWKASLQKSLWSVYKPVCTHSITMYLAYQCFEKDTSIIIIELSDIVICPTWYFQNIVVSNYRTVYPLKSSITKDKHNDIFHHTCATPYNNHDSYISLISLTYS